MIRPVVVALVVAVSTLAGCAAPNDDGAVADDVTAGESEVRSKKTEFYCSRGEGYDFDLSVKLSDQGKKLHVEWGLDNISTGDGDIDPSYRPRAGNANFVRFTGFRELDDAFGERVTTKILVEKPLLDGKGGRVKIQSVNGRGEFEQSENVCFPN